MITYNKEGLEFCLGNLKGAEEISTSLRKDLEIEKDVSEHRWFQEMKIEFYRNCSQEKHEKIQDDLDAELKKKFR